MVSVNRATFDGLLTDAIDSLPLRHREHLDNIAFIVEPEPSTAQRTQLQLRGNQTLFGLYEGVPLSARQGQTKLLPDKITLFQRPLEQASRDLADLREHVRHTIWHEVAHYYGLGHTRIHELES